MAGIKLDNKGKFILNRQINYNIIKTVTDLILEIVTYKYIYSLK